MILDFSSDNCSGVHPKILASLREASEGSAKAYGADSWTEKARQIFKSQFGRKSEVSFVFSGTAANILSLRLSLQSFEAALCVESSHLHQDECGAPEWITGTKLLTLPSTNGKVRPQDVEKFLHYQGVEHHIQPRLVSISQSSEYGTVYSLEELRELSRYCHKKGLWVHMDGARISNAAVSLNCDFGTLVSRSGIDIVSFGGTKNGLMFGEAVVVIEPKFQPYMAFHRKQIAQTFSKMRFISAQFVTYFQNNLWESNARNANAMAARLAFGLKSISTLRRTQPVEANALFLSLPRSAIPKLLKSIQFYVWNQETSEIRLMTSFNTTRNQVALALKAFHEILK